MDRRRFLGTAAGVAGAAAFASWGPRALSKPGGPNAPIVFKDTLAAQHFSVRDAISNWGPSTHPTAFAQGYLGGPNFPDDPTDLGPLVKLPGGYQEVFAFLGQCGYSGFEFFQTTQNANAPGGNNPGVAQIRTWLDAAGIKSVGTHQGGLGMWDTTVNPAGSAPRNRLTANGVTQVANAQALGHTMIGSAGDPSGSNFLGD